MTKAKESMQKKTMQSQRGGGSGGMKEAASQPAPGLRGQAQKAETVTKKSRDGDYDPGEGCSNGGGVLDTGQGIDMSSIGKLVSEAISQQFGQFGLLASKAPATPGEVTPTSNRFNLLSSESPKTTTHSSFSRATPATRKRKVSPGDENGELNKKQKPDLVNEYKVEPVYLSAVKPELTKNVIKLGKEFK
jgi:hypothetical protein